MSFEPWPSATSKSRPLAQRTRAAERDTRPTAVAPRRPPRWRPISVCGIANRRHSSSVCANARAVTSTRWPRRASSSITGRITSTCGELVRSTQTFSARSGGILSTLERRYACRLLVDASVTDSLVTLATHIIRDLGVAGVALLMLTSAVIAIPGSEPTMLFAGFNVYQHHLTLLEVIVSGV